MYTRALQLTLLSCVIALALGINYLSAWTGSTALPPNNNIAAPLNVGTTNQVKDANLSVGHSTNVATDYGLISYGRIRSTIGGVEFPDGTVQTSAGGGGSLSAITTFTSSGTWTKPAGLAYAIVEVWGGGAGGDGTGTGVPGDGGASSFKTISGAGGSATGYTRSGGGGSGGDINFSGGDGGLASGWGSGQEWAGGAGGAAPRGGPGGHAGSGHAIAAEWSGSAGKVPGGGGGGGGNYVGRGGYGGGGGGYALKRFVASALSSSESVTIGTGGAGDATGYPGGAGAGGMVVVYEYQ